MTSAETESSIGAIPLDRSECKTPDEQLDIGAAIATIKLSLCVLCWVLWVTNLSLWFVASMILSGFMYTLWPKHHEDG